MARPCRSSRPGSRSGIAGSSSATRSTRSSGCTGAAAGWRPSTSRGCGGASRSSTSPRHDLARLMARVHRTIAASGIEEGTVYVQITRGVAPRSHAFPDPPVPPTELIVVRPYDDGPTARLRETGRDGHQPARPPLEAVRHQVDQPPGQLLATEAARRAGAIEAILVDSDGLVTEATHTSLLWVRRGSARGHARGPRDPPGDDPPARPPADRPTGYPVRRHAGHARRAEGGRRADPGRDDDRGRCRSSGSTEPRSAPDGPGPIAGGCGRPTRRRSRPGWPGSLGTASRRPRRPGRME